MIPELKGAIKQRFIEERARTIGVYTLEDGSLVSELSLVGQLSAEINSQNRVAEFEVSERKVKPFGDWKPMSASEPVWLNIQNEQ